MNEKIVQYREKLTQYWKQLSKTRKIMMVSSLVAFLLIIGLLVHQFSKTEYSLAFTDLNADDAAAVKEYLTSAKIPYKLSNDGQSIGVPTKQVAEVKVDVVSQGLLKDGSLGYDIFRKNVSSFGMSDKQFDLLKNDGLAGEVEKLIKHIRGVKTADVLVNVPEKSVFLDSDQSDKATASVVVSFKPGYTVDQAKIDAIYNLVAKSVPNLSPDNITLSDENGELAPSSQAGALNTPATQVAAEFQIRQQFNDEIEKNVKKFLGSIVGPDRLVVSVVSSIDFSKKSSEEHFVTPVNTVDQKGIEISLQEIQKTYSSDGGTASSVAGTGSTDVPGYPSSTNSGKTNSEDVSRTINYEVNRITNQIESSPYTVKDLTINVGIEPPKKNKPSSLPQETKDAVKRLLMNIVGASLADSGKTYTDAELEKKVLVLTQTFKTPQTAKSSSSTGKYMMYGAGGLVLALLLGGGIWALARRNRKEEIMDEFEAVAPQIEYPSIDIEQVNNESQVRKQLESLAKKKPDEFVNLLRTWLVDE